VWKQELLLNREPAQQESGHEQTVANFSGVCSKKNSTFFCFSCLLRLLPSFFDEHLCWLPVFDEWELFLSWRRSLTPSDWSNFSLGCPWNWLEFKVLELYDWSGWQANAASSILVIGGFSPEALWLKQKTNMKTHTNMRCHKGQNWDLKNFTLIIDRNHIRWQ